MVNWAITNKSKSFLDPAVGEGIFIKIAQKTNKKLNITAFDIDDYWCQNLQNRIKKTVSKMQII